MPPAVDSARRRARAHLGRCLRLARTFAGDPSQASVGQQIRVDRGTLADWEAGESEPGGVNLIRLAEIYGVTLDALCGRTGLPVPPLP